MLYPCTEQDRAAVLEYLSAEPEMNLFFLGDIENHGIDCDPVHLFALPGAAGWDGLVLQYFDFYLFYSRSTVFDAAAVAAFLGQRKMACLSGKLSLLEQLAPYFPGKTLRPTYLSRCSAVQGNTPCAGLPGAEIRSLGPEWADAITDLLLATPEFADSYVDAEGPARSRRATLDNLATGGLIYGAVADGELVCSAQTSAAYSRGAMVVCVATAQGCRGRGYASAVVSELCRASFAQGKQYLCLFYDNPAAGRIYRRIGFSEMGRYAMLR